MEAHSQEHTPCGVEEVFNEKTPAHLTITVQIAQSLHTTDRFRCPASRQKGKDNGIAIQHLWPIPHLEKEAL
ncbi:hypothetical protein AOLI_G00276680 [Acnodon oligacanthus]